MCLQQKDNTMLKTETMLFIVCNECDGIIIIFWKQVYCLEMFLRWARRPMGLKGDTIHVWVTFMEFLLLVSGVIF